MDFEKDLRSFDTEIAGLRVFDLCVHGDDRGWFKENWQQAKMSSCGLPDFHPVQNNISFNAQRGVTRGIHAEPWDKYISVASGSIFGVWVDLRAGEGFGRVFSCRIDPSKAVFVPRGVGNAFQALEDGTVYTYLVNAHWSQELKESYTFVNLADEQLAIEWPIPLSECELSQADRDHPALRDVSPMQGKRTLVTGCNGQLGRAVRQLANERKLVGFDYCDIDTFDFSDIRSYDDIPWDAYGAVINCGAYTAVDRAESPEGRVMCWKANALGPSLLTQTCARHGITLVHVSSEYVFDGSRELHDEDETYAPLSVYGQSKAAGDIALSCCPKYYIVRTSWVIGDGHNFVKTMARLSDRCADSADSLDSVSVVNDQLGRPTFADELARGIFWLLDTRPAYGIYNLSNAGRIASWYDIARRTFEMRNGNGHCVHATSTADYYAGSEAPVACRPRNSALSLEKMCRLGFEPRDWEGQLSSYMRRCER